MIPYKQYIISKFGDRFILVGSSDPIRSYDHDLKTNKTILGRIPTLTTLTQTLKTHFHYLPLSRLTKYIYVLSVDFRSFQRNVRVFAIGALLKTMENREDLNSVLEFLPVILRSSALFWPSHVVEVLKALSQGPRYSKVDSGEALFITISKLRTSLNLSSDAVASSTADGYSLFFDDLLSRAEADKWFAEILPALADSLLRLPSMLEAHYQSADSITCVGARAGLKTGLRLLKSQETGIVLLSQELIGALLACSFFCLFPNGSRGANHLPVINFDRLFATLYDDNDNKKQENKIKCIIHYFKRISSSTPAGNVSFERKVLANAENLDDIPYPKAESWSKSKVSLCPFEVCSSGLIENNSKEALEVDFANKYLGGGALTRGCVQEEIRFMISPELIAGMFFLPRMAENEAIEVVGAERFSKYRGYASSFCFYGDFMDEKDIDIMGRRKTRIIAIDALVNPGERQYKRGFLLREINKAFCGFSDPSISQAYEILFKDGHFSESESLSFEDEIGIVTGNWGCGSFGGDPELKSILQWLAASQALRPFMVYYTSKMKALQTLEVTEWIMEQKWNVKDVWNAVVVYSSQRTKRETVDGFFKWVRLYHPPIHIKDENMRMTLVMRPIAGSKRMENRDDLNSILEFLPVVLRSSAFFWPSQVVEALKALSKGPDHSNVNSGEVLFLAICDLRNSLNLSADALAYSTADGFSLFFDDLISRAEANKWFAEILPPLADSLLRLPSMLEAHYQAADSITRIGARAGLKTGLRLLKSQEPGIVLLSQELIGALLACSFFCLFPNSCREANNLNVINFDHLFASLYDNYNEKQENKIKCIIHYFERICSSMPVGNVSFERKVLADNHNLNYIPYPNAECWSKSMASLCLFEVCSLGLIEDTSKEALEVDFANKYLGGGALTKGCLQVDNKALKPLHLRFDYG
ncbi:hypothetical protein LXL04_033419 [Taraxacum kok-saghyz]